MNAVHAAELAACLWSGWFHGKIERKDADALLEEGQAGSFLIRVSANSIGSYVLSFRGPAKVQHFPITVKGPKFECGGRQFESLAAIVLRYKAHPLIDDSKLQFQIAPSRVHLGVAIKQVALLSIKNLSEQASHPLNLSEKLSRWCRQSPEALFKGCPPEDDFFNFPAVDYADLEVDRRAEDQLLSNINGTATSEDEFDGAHVDEVMVERYPTGRHGLTPRTRPTGPLGACEIAFKAQKELHQPQPAVARECAVCMVESVCIRLEPCGHQVLCQSCVDELVGMQSRSSKGGNCPICRAAFADYTQAPRFGLLPDIFDSNRTSKGGFMFAGGDVKKTLVKIAPEEVE
jgi:hypothetical protein